MRTFATRLWMRTDNTARASMISFALAQLSRKDPINENHIAENDRQHHQRAHQKEYMRRGRRRRLPDREGGWNEIGKVRDQKPEIAQQEERDCSKEREDIAVGVEPAPCRKSNERGRRRNPPKEEDIRQREPSRCDAFEGEGRPNTHDRHAAEHRE